MNVECESLALARTICRCVLTSFFPSLPGPPITEDSLISYLLRHNVTVGVGPRGVGPLGHPNSAEMTNSRARNLRFDVGEVRFPFSLDLLSFHLCRRSLSSLTLD